MVLPHNAKQILQRLINRWCWFTKSISLRQNKRSMLGKENLSPGWLISGVVLWRYPPCLLCLRANNKHKHDTVTTKSRFNTRPHKVRRGREGGGGVRGWQKRRGKEEEVEGEYIGFRIKKQLHIRMGQICLLFCVNRREWKSWSI